MAAKTLKLDPTKSIKSDPDSDPLLPAKNYLNDNFDFKINEITQRAIFRRKGETNYQVLTDFLRNTIYLELKAHGKKIVFDDFKKLLFSDFLELSNPLKEFIEKQSKRVKNEEIIEQIANTVKVENDKNWSLYFKKWFVAMIANVFDKTRCTNHTCLVLAGEQGDFKTTFLESLIPDDLIEYRYTGQIKPENKDMLKHLALRLLVVIDDQLHKLNKTNEDDLKFLITLNTVTYRGLFKEFDYDLPRLASFCGSVNGKEYLTDLTGSRRFLSFYVKNIDMDALSKIDIAKAYGQAYNLFEDGFKYWFDKADIKEINQENEEFTTVIVEKEMIEKFFDLKNPKNESYSATEILSKLEGFTKKSLSTKKIGETMRKLGIEKKNMYNENGNRRLAYPITFRLSDDNTTNDSCPY
jgi:predicted P-loop ATPase